jgi:16S rRNA G1207 methylase RsmC
VQEELANRAIELLNLPADKEHFILDVGCGSGLSGGAFMALEGARQREASHSNVLTNRV